MTLQDAKNEVAKKHHWENWDDILNTGMDEGMLVLLTDEANELFYAQHDCACNGFSPAFKNLYDQYGDLLKKYKASQSVPIQQQKPDRIYTLNDILDFGNHCSKFHNETSVQSKFKSWILKREPVSESSLPLDRSSELLELKLKRDVLMTVWQKWCEFDSYVKFDEWLHSELQKQ